jgi:hypothetical protein
MTDIKSRRREATLVVTGQTKIPKAPYQRAFTGIFA